MQRDTQQALTTPSTVRVEFPIEIVYLHLPQPANTIRVATISTTAIDRSFSNQQTMRDTQLPYTVSVVFPIQFPTAIELLQLPLVDNDTPACTTHQNIFHHHQLLNLQVVLSSLLQLASTTRYMSGHLQ